MTSEPAADTPLSEHSTIPLAFAYHPANQLIKNIISRNFHFLWDDADTACTFTSKYSCVSENVVSMLSNAMHVTRFVTEKLIDARVTDLGNIYTPQGYQSQIFLLEAILLPQGTQLKTCWFQTNVVLRPWWSQCGL